MRSFRCGRQSGSLLAAWRRIRWTDTKSPNTATTAESLSVLVGREDPCPRCNQPTRWLNTVTVSPEGSAVRYFTICSPLCRCPDDHIRDQIARILAEIVAKEWRSGWLKVGDSKPEK